MESNNFEEEMKESVDETIGVHKHSEALASVNIKVWIDRYPAMFTFRGDNPTQVITQAVKFIELAKKGGWKTDWNDTPAKTETANTPPPQNDRPEEAFCKTHNKPMNKRKGPYGEFWACGTRLSDGSWCKETYTQM